MEERSLPITTFGYINGVSDSKVSLTFNDGFIYGFIRSEGEMFYIEPLNHIMNETDLENKFVFYNVKDIIDNEEHKCGAEVDEEQMQN